jgi:hypothetical protein
MCRASSGARHSSARSTRTFDRRAHDPGRIPAQDAAKGPGGAPASPRPSTCTGTCIPETWISTPTASTMRLTRPRAAVRPNRARQRRRRPGRIMTEPSTCGDCRALGGTRTPNLLVRSYSIRTRWLGFSRSDRSQTYAYVYVRPGRLLYSPAVRLSAWEPDCHASVTTAPQARGHLKLSASTRQVQLLSLRSGTQRAQSWRRSLFAATRCV